MKSLEKLENRISDWLKPLPQLPVTARKWIATNAWWIMLIGVILSAVSTIFMIFGVFAAIPLMTVTTSTYGYYASPAYSGWYFVSLIISTLFMIMTVAIMAMSVTLLKGEQKRGWTLLFWVLILRAVAVVVAAILTCSLMSFIGEILWGAVGLVIGAYLLFEIRSYFVKVEVKH
jgi:hypothetical protein